MRVSVIVPSKEWQYLKYLLRNLRYQTVKPYEIVLVIKECNIKAIEELCREHSLPCIVIEQKEGYFTHALNIGKREASGDILIFTDDDVIPLSKWVERYIKKHKLYPHIAGVSSRDICFDLNSLSLKPTPDDKVAVKLYRWLVRPLFDSPHPLLKKYRLGVYITRNLNIAHGPFIPGRTCFSLPFRGVNMSFKANYVYDIQFPEHPLLKRAPSNEQYFGLQIILKGTDTIYIPDNPILHIARSESLSRTKYKEEPKREFETMRCLYRALLAKVCEGITCCSKLE